MKVDGINALDLSQYYYLEQMGLNTMFSPTAVDDNSNKRYMKETGWRGQDLQSMLDKLNISQNKFFIIRLMRRGEIVALLYLLDKNKLVEAMQLFPRSRLIQFIHHLPKENILKMLLWMIPLRVLMQLFPTEVIFNILRSKRLQVGNLVAGFENMPVEALQKLMENITGRNVDKVNPRELLAMFRQLSKEQILEGMKSWPAKHIFEFVFQEVKKDPELLMMIPRGEYMKVVATMTKPHLVEMFRLLPESQLVQCLSQLPDKLLAMAASQLDDKMFGSILINQYPHLIAELAEAA